MLRHSPSDEQVAELMADDLLPEYDIDYSKAKLNRLHSAQTGRASSRACGTPSHSLAPFYDHDPEAISETARPPGHAADAAADAADASRRAWQFGVVIFLLFFGLAARLWFCKWRGAMTSEMPPPPIRPGASAPPPREASSPTATAFCWPRTGPAGDLRRAERRQRPADAGPPGRPPAHHARRHSADIDATRTNPYDPLRIALDVPMTMVTQIEENRPYLPGVPPSRSRCAGIRTAASPRTCSARWAGSAKRNGAPSAPKSTPTARRLHEKRLLGQNRRRVRLRALPARAARRDQRAD